MKTLEIFEAYLRFGKYVGLVRPNVDVHGRYKGLKQVMLWIQFTVVLIILWSGVIKLIMSLTIEDDIENRGLTFLCAIAFFTGTAFISTTTYIAIYREFDKFCSLLDNHRKCFGDHDGYSWIHKSRNARLTLWVSIPLMAILCGIFILFTYYNNGDLANLFWPFNFNTVLDSVITMVYYITFLFFNVWHQLLTGFFFISSSLLFIKEFKLINNKLKTVISESTKSMSPHVEVIRQEHASLVGCFESNKSLFKHYIFAIYAVTVPAIGFFLYGAIRGKMHLAEIVALFCMALMNSLANLSYTLIGATLHAKAHEPYEILNRVDILEVSDKTAESVSLFMKRLTGPPISYSIYGMMTLDSSAILQTVCLTIDYTIFGMMTLDSSGILQVCLTVDYTIYGMILDFSAILQVCLTVDYTIYGMILDSSAILQLCLTIDYTTCIYDVMILDSSTKLPVCLTIDYTIYGMILDFSAILQVCLTIDYTIYGMILDSSAILQLCLTVDYTTCIYDVMILDSSTILPVCLTIDYTTYGMILDTSVILPVCLTIDYTIYDMILDSSAILQVCLTVDYTIYSMVILDSSAILPVCLTVDYTIYDMILDSSAILQLFGTLVTYAIVMLQFAGSPSSTIVQCYNTTY
ncbi:hypothetical protein LOTGIDRAFT_159425 [Lottia gigantea]|uniref:Gustatory receptor n=1 Tax=Lottia gigantea TaxID=225164 RepID=V4C6W6_LOTGI|nr:hypothetical protein LOTGIDRAFT_159425 [Lottia gigantea]ESO97394.1 hypothetical protein LOTGIDRAFT_159425 [Lottia gigantea]